MSAGEDGDARRPIRSLPDALDRTGEIAGRLSGGPVAVFLDFDGTLAPIVSDPEEAALPPETRDALRSLARRCPVAVLSGRDLASVAEKVGLGQLYYAGSHGFDLRGPDGFRERRGEDAAEALDAAEEELSRAARRVPGAAIERKRFGVALHVRRASPDRVPELRERAEAAAGRHPALELGRGKQVLELRPAADWDKGRALLRLLQEMVDDPEAARLLHVGDDVTDEDAFRAVAGRGVAVVVQGEGDDRLTRAAFSLEGPAAVRRFLRALASRLEGPAG